MRVLLWGLLSALCAGAIAVQSWGGPLALQGSTAENAAPPVSSAERDRAKLAVIERRPLARFADFDVCSVSIVSTGIVCFVNADSGAVRVVWPLSADSPVDIAGEALFDPGYGRVRWCTYRMVGDGHSGVVLPWAGGRHCIAHRSGVVALMGPIEGPFSLNGNAIVEWRRDGVVVDGVERVRGWEAGDGEVPLVASGVGAYSAALYGRALHGKRLLRLIGLEADGQEWVLRKNIVAPLDDELLSLSVGLSWGALIPSTAQAPVLFGLEAAGFYDAEIDPGEAPADLLECSWGLVGSDEMWCVEWASWQLIRYRIRL